MTKFINRIQWRAFLKKFITLALPTEILKPTDYVKEYELNVYGLKISAQLIKKLIVFKFDLFDITKEIKFRSHRKETSRSSFV